MAGIFDYAIAYVESLATFEPLAVPARSSGVKGLAIKLHDSDGNPEATRNRDYLKVHGPTLRGSGYSLGAWVCPRYKPGQAALATSALYKELCLSFVIFETEWEYRPGANPAGIDVDDLLRPWRAIRPKAWTGFALEGTPSPEFNHAAVQADPFAVLCPENYWRSGEQYDVRRCFAAAVGLGWSLDRVKPTLSGVEGHAFDESLVRCYSALDIWEGGQGVLLWRGDMLRAEDYALFARADTLALR